jgi:hypothetical protein
MDPKQENKPQAAEDPIKAEKKAAKIAAKAEKIAKAKAKAESKAKPAAPAEGQADGAAKPEKEKEVRRSDPFFFFPFRHPFRRPSVGGSPLL